MGKQKQIDELRTQVDELRDQLTMTINILVNQSNQIDKMRARIVALEATATAVNEAVVNTALSREPVRQAPDGTLHIGDTALTRSDLWMSPDGTLLCFGGWDERGNFAGRDGQPVR